MAGRALHSRAEFLARILRFALLGLGFLACSLGLGVAGYMAFGGLAPVDAFLNAAMVLSGAGPLDPMPDDRAKLFAAIYALFGGAVYPAVMALVLYPVLHRMLTLLHLASGKDDPP
jgi:hypothetical protein